MDEMGAIPAVIPSNKHPFGGVLLSHPIPRLEVDGANFKAKVKKLPERSDVQMPIQEQLIVELYSK